MHRFVLISVAVLFVAATVWVSYIKYGEFKNRREAVSWEKYGNKPEAAGTAEPPASAGSAASSAQ